MKKQSSASFLLTLPPVEYSRMRNGKLCMDNCAFFFDHPRHWVCSVMVKGPGQSTFVNVMCGVPMPAALVYSVTTRQTSIISRAGYQGSKDSSLTQHQLDIAFYIYPLQPHEICTRNSYPVLQLEIHPSCMHALHIC